MPADGPREIRRGQGRSHKSAQRGPGPRCNSQRPPRGQNNASWSRNHSPANSFGSTE